MMNPYLSFIPDTKRFEIRLGEEIENYISKQIQDEQYITIQSLVAMSFRPNMSTLEIGSWTGLSAFLIGSIVQRSRGKHHCVDWYRGMPNGEGGLTEDIIKKYQVDKIFRDNMEFFNLNDTTIQIIKTSEEASKQFEEETFDFIFIDGDHSTKAVYNDFNLWYPKLRKNGIISGHDYMSSEEAIKSVFDKYRLPYYVDNDIWWMRKPK